MFARLLIPLCLCCVVLCGFVGFLSKQAVEEGAQISSKPLELTCGSFIDSPPAVSSGVLLSDFEFVDQIATIDNDGDGKWDEVAVPLFSPDGFKSQAGYSGVVARLRDAPDLETLHQRLAPNKLQTYYRIDDQNLGLSLHSQLAMKFKHMDFEHSPIVTIGYGSDNPLLGETTLKYSYLVGAAAIGVALLSLVYLVVIGLIDRVPKRPRRKPTRNRAGLSGESNSDNELTGGVLDRASSMRNQQPQV